MYRKIVLILLLVLPFSSFAKPEKVDYFAKKAESLLTDSEKLSLTEKSKNLLTLKAEIQKSLDEYQKTNKGTPSPEEYDVASLFVALRPAFSYAEKKKVDAKSCEDSQFAIERDNNKNNTDDTLTKNGQIALSWLKLLCK